MIRGVLLPIGRRTLHTFLCTPIDEVLSDTHNISIHPIHPGRKISYIIDAYRIDDR